MLSSTILQTQTHVPAAIFVEESTGCAGRKTPNTSADAYVVIKQRPTKNYNISTARWHCTE